MSPGSRSGSQKVFHLTASTCFNPPPPLPPLKHAAFSTDGDFVMEFDYEYGGTFVMAVVAFCLGLIEGVTLLVLAGWAPRTTDYIHRCMASAGVSAIDPLVGGLGA